MIVRRIVGAALLGAALMTGQASRVAALDLNVGISAIPTSMDPHFQALLINQHPQQQVFEPLVTEDGEGGITGVLALSWRAVDDLTWEFKLRPKVTFHDGTPFSADDVVFSFARVPTVPNSPNPLTSFTKAIAAVEKIDDLTVRMRTQAPHPFLPLDITLVSMLSRTIHAQATTADFNAGRMVIGTGPYRFAAFSQGERFEVVRNETWWGGLQPWTKISFRMMSSDPSRIAALLAGDVDLIDKVPVTDLATLRGKADIALASTPAYESYYLFPDAARDASPLVTGKGGQTLSGNPLKDRRVREALSIAIDRKAIVERVMDGAALPAEQLSAPKAVGRSPNLKPIAYDPARAKKLLAEAGYPDGFGLTLHASRGWLPNDDKIAQAIAQYFTRIGVETKVEAMPVTVFLPKASNREFSLFMGSWAGSHAINPLRSMLMTRDAAQGFGAGNRMHYSNPAFDALVKTALVTIDDGKRNAGLAQAMDLAMADVAAIPILHPLNIWAMKKAVVSYAASPLAKNQGQLATPAKR